MKDEYYTPEIEELHIGFEYETLDWTGFTGELGENSNYDWVSFTITENSTLSEFIKMIENEDIRVKYLNKEDIENVLNIKQLKGNDIELNFQLQVDEHLFYEFDYNTDTKILAVELWVNNEKMRISEYQTIFFGTIKNKSELIKLMKWLNI